MSIVATIIDMICTFNEVFWQFQWVNLILNKKEFVARKEKNLIKVELFMCIIDCIMVFFMNRIALTSAYTMLAVEILTLGAVMLFWECDIVQDVAINGLYLFLLFLWGNIIISVSGMIGGENLVRVTTMEKGLPRIIYLLFGGSLWFWMNKGVYSYFKKKSTPFKGIRYIALLSIVGETGSAFLGTIMVSSFNIHVNTTWYAFLAIILVLAFGYYFVVKQKEEQMQITMLTAHAELLERNYMQVNDFYMVNAKLYHDMNHHFNALYHMLQDGQQKQAISYLERLRGEENEVRIKVQSGINVLDAILSEMDKRAGQKNVKFVVETPILPCDIGLESRDICSLFGNLLDNAIESSSQSVMLNIKKVNKTILITVKNDYIVAPIKKNGRFITSKRQKNMHGWGTQIIEQIVEKYDVSIEYEVDEHFFTVYAMLCEHEIA